MIEFRVLKMKINFEIIAFLNYEWGTSRLGNSKSNKNKKLFFSFHVLNFPTIILEFKIFFLFNTLSYSSLEKVSQFFGTRLLHPQNWIKVKKCRWYRGICSSFNVKSCILYSVTRTWIISLTFLGGMQHFK